MGFPAARVSDMHVCPMVTPALVPIPHVGGPILPPGGIPVIVGGMPAARLADMAVCVGPPDMIAKASFTVLIAKKPAARMLDLTVHGGVILSGFPTVLIGDAGAVIGGLPVTMNPDGSATVGSNIRIVGSREYVAQVLADLAIIGALPEGRAMLQARESSGQRMTIQTRTPTTPPNASAGPANWADATPAGQPVFNGRGNPVNDIFGNQRTGTGNGTSSTVRYNPSEWPTTAFRTNPPGDAILFHEMTHANNQANGTHDGTPRGGNWTTNEEFNTIGPENRYRDQRGHPRRRNHGDL